MNFNSFSNSSQGRRILHGNRLLRIDVVVFFIIYSILGALKVSRANVIENNVNNDEYVIVRRVVSANSNFKESPEEFINNLANTGLAKLVKFNDGDKLWNRVPSLYGKFIGANEYSRKALVSVMQQYNDIENPSKMQSNIIAIPAIPKLTVPDKKSIPSEIYLDDPEQMHAYLRDVSENMPKKKVSVKFYQSDGVQKYDINPAISSSVKIFASEEVSQGAGAGAVDAEIQYFRLPKSDADNLISKNNFEPVSYPLVAKLDADDGSYFPNILRQEDVVKLKSLLNGPQASHKKPILLIFDDSWPNKKSFEDTKKFFLEEAFPAIWKNRRNWGSYKAPDSLVMQSDTNWPTRPVYGNGVHAYHSELIDDSLKPFIELDTQGLIKIIYLPMNKAQLGASDIFRDLLRMHFNYETPYYAKGFADIDTQARYNYDELISTILEQLNSTIEKGVANSNQALFESVITFMRLYSIATEEPIFLNISWTTNNLKYSKFTLDQTTGLIIAAAGNDGDNVLSSNTLFGSRSVRHDDVLAVMNLDEKGKAACNSSLVPIMDEIHAFAVGFSGTIHDGICGTSFAAPRVAWLIAAKEAFETKPENFSENSFTWFIKLKTRILKMHKRIAENEYMVNMLPNTWFSSEHQ